MRIERQLAMEQKKFCLSVLRTTHQGKRYWTAVAMAIDGRVYGQGGLYRCSWKIDKMGLLFLSLRNLRNRIKGLQWNTLILFNDGFMRTASMFAMNQVVYGLSKELVNVWKDITKLFQQEGRFGASTIS